MELTPAQSAFLQKSIPGIQFNRWSVTNAGFAGSDRRFLRIRQSSGNNESFILVLWDSHDADWDRFIAIQKELSGKVPFLPSIYAYDEVHGLILEEDLGTFTLSRFIKEHPEDIEKAYRLVLDALIQWQRIDVISSPVIASRSLDLEVFLWESRYFATHCITEFFGYDSLLTQEWEKERTQIALEASAFPKVYIHRDFQSENILIHNGAVRFVDYQGARLGPAGYDAASLLFDPYIQELENSLSDKLFEYYQRETENTITLDSFYICSIQRLMQALGAYGNLSIHKGKERYRQFIPVAINRCVKIIEQLPRFPVLQRILYACKDKK